MQSIDEGYVYPGGPLWDGENLVQDKPDVYNHFLDIMKDFKSQV